MASAPKYLAPGHTSVPVVASGMPPAASGGQGGLGSWLGGSESLCAGFEHTALCRQSKSRATCTSGSWVEREEHNILWAAGSLCSDSGRLKPPAFSLWLLLLRSAGTHLGPCRFQSFPLANLYTSNLGKGGQIFSSETLGRRDDPERCCGSRRSNVCVCVQVLMSICHCNPIFSKGIHSGPWFCV